MLKSAHLTWVSACCTYLVCSVQNEANLYNAADTCGHQSAIKKNKNRLAAVESTFSVIFRNKSLLAEDSVHLNRIVNLLHVRHRIDNIHWWTAYSLAHDQTWQIQ